MVSLVEDVSGDLKSIEKELSEAVAASSVDDAAATAGKVIEQKEEAAVELPTKLKDKTPAEIADMYRNLESAYGRMANDLGHQRVLTDRLLNLKRETDLTANKPAPVKVESADLLNDPTSTLDKYITSRESQREDKSAERIAALEAQIASQNFVTRHPDYTNLVQSPELQQWLQATPYRARLASQAVNGDFVAADELLTEFKAQRKTPPKQQGDDVDGARKAGLETSTTVGTESGKKPGKVYRRSDLLKLQIEKPDTYYSEDYQREIIRAYAEKRVK